MYIHTHTHGKKSVPGHILVKLQKEVLPRRRSHCRLTVDFSKIAMKARRQNDSFFVRCNYQGYIVNSVKIPCKNEEKTKTLSRWKECHKHKLLKRKL